jgi:Ca2+:H+ antiporter
MLGNILFKILLVTGSCFIAGGVYQKQQAFNVATPSLVAISTTLLIIPAMLCAILNENSSADVQARIVILSRGTAGVLLFIYAIYLFFQPHTHADLSVERTNENARPQLLPPWTAGVLVVSIIGVVTVCATCLIDSIDSVAKPAHVNRTYIGLILIPIVGNVVNYFTAMTLAYKNRMDYAIDVIVVGSLRTALLVTPSLIMLSWIMNRNLDLSFDKLEAVSFTLAALVYMILIEDGKSNYLKGCLSVVSCTRS